jgi:hypothetical protein
VQRGAVLCSPALQAAARCRGSRALAAALPRHGTCCACWPAVPRSVMQLLPTRALGSTVQQGRQLRRRHAMKMLLLALPLSTLLCWPLFWGPSSHCALGHAGLNADRDAYKDADLDADLHADLQHRLHRVSPGTAVRMMRAKCG